MHCNGINVLTIGDALEVSAVGLGCMTMTGDYGAGETITVCDPAVGSGHFVIAAAHRLASQRFGLAATGRALLGSSWLARSNSRTWA